MMPPLRTTELLWGRYIFVLGAELAVWRLLVAEPERLFFFFLKELQ